VKLYYCGIGSRKVPIKIGNWMTSISGILEQCGYTLRSGKALGSDTFFEKGVKNPDNKEIFIHSDAKPWAFAVVKRYMPNDRPDTFDSWDAYVKGLLARNMMQVLGENGEEPVKFVVCWTPQGDYQSSDVGGTGYALRCALDHGIPTYNLNYPDQMNAFKDLMRDIFKEHQNAKAN
jgi:hypothetical protein